MPFANLDMGATRQSTAGSWKKYNFGGLILYRTTTSLTVGGNGYQDSAPITLPDSLTASDVAILSSQRSGGAGQVIHSTAFATSTTVVVQTRSTAGVSLTPVFDLVLIKLF